ncbi:MAG: Rrf2 family transcriptional regulator [Phycisphaeraceae bacterium]|nr:Rrf2 family transcriptional regulator [Phycisphaeraceae bacterium]
MLFSQTAEYALRAAVCLADRAGQPQTTQQIAEATRVPAGYLSKVLQALGRADLVTSQRGIGGGFLLARDADAISVLDVVAAVDPIQRIATCPLGLAGHGSNLCPLHRKLDDALASIEQAFASTSLAELLKTPGKIRPLCEVKITGDGANIAS